MEYMVSCIVAHQAQLGEGPIWDSRRQALFYVDITGKEIRCYHPKNGACSAMQTEQMVGCIVPDENGGLLAAEKNTLVRIDPDTGARTPILRISTADYLRFNDGKCDAAGRLWAGTMAADQAHPRAKVCGALYQIEDGAAEKLVFDHMAIPNGIAFDSENRFFYHIDTATQQICRYTLELTSGALSDKRIVVTVPKEEGSPDGMTMDHEGMLWVALWGGSQVARYHPGTGEKLCAIPVPVKNVSCCTFGGEHMDELFITTAMDEDGNGGELYACKTRVHGFAPFPYRSKRRGIR